MKRILLFTTILILCLCSPVWGATYWWDPTGGNDANGGTSNVDAELTWAAAIAHLSAADTLKVVDGTHNNIGDCTITPAGSGVGTETIIEAETYGGVTFTGTARFRKL